MIKKIIYAGVLIVLFSLHVLASNQIMFDKANQAYHNQSYNEAITWYQQMIDEGYNDAVLFYNAGNAYFKNKQYGMAIKCYQQALNINQDQRTLDNLTIVRRAVQEPIYPSSMLNKTMLPLINKIPINYWSLGSLLSFAGIMTWLILKLLRKSPKPAIAYAILGVYICTTLGMMLSYYYREVSVPMVVIKSKTLFTPLKPSSSRNCLYDGTEVRGIEQQKQNTLIELPNGERGWVSSNDISRW